MNTISFPGLGIGPFSVNEIAFTIPFLENFRGVAWYAIIITFGMILAFSFVVLHSKKEGIKSDDVIDLAIFLLPSAIIGARLYYVIFYGGYTSFIDAIAFWNGGLAIYGGIIAGSIAVVGVMLFKKINPLKMFDLIAPALMIGQAIGRWGNFVNAEAYGAETDLPWRMGILTPGMTKMIYVHPTFLYESLWNIIGFLLIYFFVFRKKKYNGQVMLAYFAWYGFGRMIIEGLRTDSLWLGTFRISQVIGFVSFVVATALLIYCGIKARKKRLEEESYSLQYEVGERIISAPDQDEIATDNDNSEKGEKSENGTDN